MENSAGQQIGQYRVLEAVGQGGMATVFKAYHPKLDRVVAIKMIHQNFLDDESFVARFEREAQIIARLEHPNIVPVYDYAEHHGLPYLVMKYIEGSNLKSVLSGGPLQFSDVTAVMHAIASALDYAHSQGVLHRDIKPSNVMLDMRATPYLADFGLARLVTGGASTMSVDMLIGTPYYMSPEQARGDTDLDARTDIYSLGVMLYELLTGTVPYSGTTPYSIIHQHITAELPPLRAFNPNLPSDLESVVNRALAKERDARYESAGALMTAVRAALPPDAWVPDSESSSILSLKDSRPLSVSVVAASKAPRKSVIMPPLQTPSAPEPFPSLTPPPTPTPMSAPGGETFAPPSLQSDMRKRRVRVRGCLGRIALVLVAGFLLLAILSNARRDNSAGDVPTDATPPTNAVVASETPDQLTGAELYAATQTAAARTVPTQPPAAPTVADGAAPVALDVPTLSLEDAQAAVDAAPDDASAYLALFRAQLAARERDAVAATLETGAEVAENAAQFVLTAAETAFAMGENGVAVIVLRDALSRLRDDPSYLLLRSQGGALLYEAALTPASPDLFAVRSLTEVSSLNRNDASPIFTAMVARALLTHGNPRLAGLALELAMRRDRQMPEGRLIDGEIKLAQGNEVEARRIWEVLQGEALLPPWVRERLAELMG